MRRIDSTITLIVAMASIAVALVLVFKVSGSFDDDLVDRDMEEYWNKIPMCDGSISHFEVRADYERQVQAAVDVFDSKGWSNITVDQKRAWTEVEADCEVLQ